MEQNRPLARYGTTATTTTAVAVIQMSTRPATANYVQIPNVRSYLASERLLAQRIQVISF